MEACGGLMTAMKESTPYMPRLDTVTEPPVYSSGLSALRRARSASSLASAAITDRDFPSASRMTGVMSPSSMATAIPTSPVWNCRMRSPWSETFTFGTLCSASPAALTMKSFTETLSSAALASSRMASTASMSTSMDR